MTKVASVLTRVPGLKLAATGLRIPGTTQGRQNYYDTLHTLSQASVDQHFDAFKDIAWDDPENAIRPDDERFILTEADEIGAHPWYKALPKERQIEIGQYRLAQICKVGRQFEQLLISGVMNHLVWMESENPEFRYATHEVTEETHHTQMFQRTVDLLAPHAAGAPAWFKVFFPLMAAMGRYFPEWFFVGILAGEEPIDHQQKNVMRAGGGHPLANRVMQIHIAEEARHIGFAHRYLEQHVPELGFLKRQALTVLFPLTMRVLCDAIMVPNEEARQHMGIPDEVAKEIWWSSKESRARLRHMFGDVRMLAEELGMRTGPAKLLWKAVGIDGRPSRYRGEVASASD
jgi:hypothetical protein